MCGRYTNSGTDAGKLRERFELPETEPIAPATLGRANIAPSQEVLAIVRGYDNARHSVRLRWGLAPSWGQLRGGPTLINARDDKLRSSRAWRPLVSSAYQRALLIGDGWIEWQRAEDPKRPRQPFLHRLDSGEPFAFAALWLIARPKDCDEEIASAAIVTTAANREVAHIHDRMPVVLDGPAAEEAWLDPAVDLHAALELTQPLPDGLLEIQPVDPRINSSRDDDLDLLAPVQALAA